MPAACSSTVFSPFPPAAASGPPLSQPARQAARRTDPTARALRRATRDRGTAERAVKRLFLPETHFHCMDERKVRRAGRRLMSLGSTRRGEDRDTGPAAAVTGPQWQPTTKSARRRPRATGRPVDLHQQAGRESHVDGRGSVTRSGEAERPSTGRTAIRRRTRDRSPRKFSRPPRRCLRRHRPPAAAVPLVAVSPSWTVGRCRQVGFSSWCWASSSVWSSTWPARKWLVRRWWSARLRFVPQGPVRW